MTSWPMWCRVTGDTETPAPVVTLAPSLAPLTIALPLEGPLTPLWPAAPGGRMEMSAQARNVSCHNTDNIQSSSAVCRLPEARSPAGRRPRCRHPSCCRMCRSTAVARVTQGRDTAAYLQHAVAALQTRRQLHRHVVETLQLAHDLKLLAVLQQPSYYSQQYPRELETKIHPKVRNHGEGPY